MHGRVHGTYTAVHTGRKDGRADGRVHVYGPCTAMYTTRTRSGTDRVPAVFCHVPAAYTAVFGTLTMCMARVCLYMEEGGRAQSVHGRLRPCTDCVHGRARAMYMVRP